ncbi:MAG TPA: exosortase/archaeosortase family protein [Chthoniobacterales bacterium]|nr:exosortase/archaeosortase family protein [Chthoniobacterales bacterium]
MRVSSNTAKMTVKPGDKGRPCTLSTGNRFYLLFVWTIAVGAAAAPLLWHLSCFWQIDPQYYYGWIVPPLCIYLAWKRFPSRPAVEPGPAWGAICLIAALLLLSCVWLVRDATPDWSVVSWSLAILTVGILLLLVTRAGGISTARHFLFPICFILIAVPWPHGLEYLIVQNLMKFVAAAAAEFANWAGVAALPEGSLIRLPHGYVGISEACSGMRSLQAVLMASLFLGELQRWPIFQRGLLLISAAGIAILCNVARAIALVLIFSQWGGDALKAWHDATGLAVLVVAFALLGLTASRMFAQGVPGSGYFTNRRLPASGPLSLPPTEVVAVCVWATATFAATEFWYGHADPAALRLDIHWPEGQRAFRDLPVPDDARHNLLCDEGRIATWFDPDGGNWTLCTFRWAPGRTATQSARLHRPENCFTAIGAVLERDLGSAKLMIDGVPITFRSYLFERNGAPVIVFYTIWEEANRDRLSGDLLQDYSGLSRLQRVLRRQRNLGQQSLEFVLTGRTDFSAARAEFERTLPLLVGWKST